MWFLLIPPVAVLIAIFWLVSRNRQPRQEAMITIEGYRRGMAALARSMEVPRQPSGLDDPTGITGPPGPRPRHGRAPFGPSAGPGAEGAEGIEAHQPGDTGEMRAREVS
jgi:hypothetical protein